MSRILRFATAARSAASLAHADPASELPACMLALNATVIVRGQTGERRIAAQDFFTGIYETALSPEELLVAVELPAKPKNSTHFFHEFARRHGDYAILGLAAQAIVEGTAWPIFACILRVGDRPVLAKAASRFVRRDADAGGAGCCVRRFKRRTPSARTISRRRLRCAGIWLKCCWRAAWQGCSAARSQRRGTGLTAHVQISLDVNGERVEAHVLPRQNLADFLREHLQLTGRMSVASMGFVGHVRCGVNGDIVRSCLMLAVQTQNASVETIEGLSDSGEIADLQTAFRDRNALQCGFCTPGMRWRRRIC